MSSEEIQAMVDAIAVLRVGAASVAAASAGESVVWRELVAARNALLLRFPQFREPSRNIAYTRRRL